MSEHVVVVGAGQAAIAFAAKLRSLCEDTKITLIGEEPHLPYQRPPLSKAYVKGEMGLDGLKLRADGWYETNAISCLTSRNVEKLDKDSRRITLFDGETIGFDRLVFATGSRPCRLPANLGGELENVFVIRTIADADKFRDHLAEGKKLVIIGGGYIGLEAAAVARSFGMEVTLTEMAERILQRVACKETSAFLRQLHRDNGVTLLEQTGLKSLEGADGVVTGATLANGERIAADLVIAGIGVLPNEEIASQAGIEVENGIRVDLRGQTSAKGIYACGDCASFEFRGQIIRLESVQNAIDQAENVASTIAAEILDDETLAKDYHPVPWFWSDQYDVKLQIAGLNSNHDQIVHRKGAREGTCSFWYFRAGEFLSVDAMNDARAYMVGKRLLETGKTITPEQAADSGLELKTLLK